MARRARALDVRWSAGDINRAAFLAKELVGQPDAILANTTSVTAAIQRETQVHTDCFVIVFDPGKRLCRKPVASGWQHHWLS